LPSLPDIKFLDTPVVDAEVVAPAGKPCAACGTPIEPLDRFCPACGTVNPDFKSAQATAPITTPAATNEQAAEPSPLSKVL